MQKKERKQKREKAIIKNLTQMLYINTKFKITRINRLLALLGKVNNMKKHIYYEVTLRNNWKDMLKIKIIELKEILVDVWQKQAKYCKQIILQLKINKFN